MSPLQNIVVLSKARSLSTVCNGSIKTTKEVIEANPILVNASVLVGFTVYVLNAIYFSDTKISTINVSG